MHIVKPNISEHRNVNFNIKLFKTFLATQKQHIVDDSNTGVLVWCTLGSKSRGDIKLRFPTLRSSVGRRSLFKNNELFCSQLQNSAESCAGDAQIFAAHCPVFE